MIVGLADLDARELLVMVLPDRLDDRVVDRLVAETHWQPAGAARIRTEA